MKPKVLENFKKECKKQNIPVITDNTEKFIKKLLIKYKPKLCIEVGSAVGYSGIFIAKTISKRWGKIYSFELSYQSYRQAIKNKIKFEAWNIIFYNMNFLEAPLDKILEEKVDFVFIDAMKRHYDLYFRKILSLLSKKSIIVFDDVIKYKEKVKNLYLFLEKNQIFYEIKKLDEDDWIMIIKD